MNDRRRSRGVDSFEELEVGGAVGRVNASSIAIEFDADADADGGDTDGDV